MNTSTVRQNRQTRRYTPYTRFTRVTREGTAISTQEITRCYYCEFESANPKDFVPVNSKRENPIGSCNECRRKRREQRAQAKLLAEYDDEELSSESEEEDDDEADPDWEPSVKRRRQSSDALVESDDETVGSSEFWSSDEATESESEEESESEGESESEEESEEELVKTPVRRQKKPKMDTEKRMIKRPLNAWMFFCQDNKNTVTDELQRNLLESGKFQQVGKDGKPIVSTGQIFNQLKKKWDQLQPTQMSVYTEKAEADKKRYLQEIDGKTPDQAESAFRSDGLTADKVWALMNGKY